MADDSDGPQRPFRCPKCGGGDLSIFEHFLVTDVITVSGGVAIERRPGGGDALGKFSAECACGHTWRPRYETGSRALEAVRALEDE